MITGLSAGIATAAAVIAGQAHGISADFLIGFAAFCAGLAAMQAWGDIDLPVYRI
jgi:hypothetical protein